MTSMLFWRLLRQCIKSFAHAQSQTLDDWVDAVGRLPGSAQMTRFEQYRMMGDAQAAFEEPLVLAYPGASLPRRERIALVQHLLACAKAAGFEPGLEGRLAGRWAMNGLVRRGAIELARKVFGEADSVDDDAIFERAVAEALGPEGSAARWRLADIWLDEADPYFELLVPVPSPEVDLPGVAHARLCIGFLDQGRVPCLQGVEIEKVPEAWKVRVPEGLREVAFSMAASIVCRIGRHLDCAEVAWVAPEKALSLRSRHCPVEASVREQIERDHGPLMRDAFAHLTQGVPQRIESHAGIVGVSLKEPEPAAAHRSRPSQMSPA